MWLMLQRLYCAIQCQVGGCYQTNQLGFESYKIIVLLFRSYSEVSDVHLALYVSTVFYKQSIIASKFAG